MLRPTQREFLSTSRPFAIDFPRKPQADSVQRIYLFIALACTCFDTPRSRANWFVNKIMWQSLADCVQTASTATHARFLFCASIIHSPRRERKCGIVSRTPCMHESQHLFCLCWLMRGRIGVKWETKQRRHRGRKAVQLKSTIYLRSWLYFRRSSFDDQNWIKKSRDWVGRFSR